MKFGRWPLYYLEFDVAPEIADRTLWCCDNTHNFFWRLLPRNQGPCVAATIRGSGLHVKTGCRKFEKPGGPSAEEILTGKLILGLGWSRRRGKEAKPSLFAGVGSLEIGVLCEPGLSRARANDA